MKRIDMNSVAVYAAAYGGAVFTMTYGLKLMRPAAEGWMLALGAFVLISGVYCAEIVTRHVKGAMMKPTMPTVNPIVNDIHGNLTAERTVAARQNGSAMFSDRVDI